VDSTLATLERPISTDLEEITIQADAQAFFRCFEWYVLKRGNTFLDENCTLWQFGHQVDTVDGAQVYGIQCVCSFGYTKGGSGSESWWFPLTSFKNPKVTMMGKYRGKQGC
jgi:hypothetical protein